LGALIVTVAFVLSGCGSGSTGNVAGQRAATAGNRASAVTRHTDLAAHTDAVVRGHRGAQNWARLAAALGRAWRHRFAANRAARHKVGPPLRETVVETIGPASDDICAPNGPHGGSRAIRQAHRDRALLRNQALYFLNLSCPTS
jgi:hypothetical protein